MGRGTLKRTEFVIVMYWAEPLPTDPQSKDEAMEPASGGDTTGFGGAAGPGKN